MSYYKNPGKGFSYIGSGQWPTGYSDRKLNSDIYVKNGRFYSIIDKNCNIQDVMRITCKEFQDWVSKNFNPTPNELLI